jgi:hypothetical protein
MKRLSDEKKIEWTLRIAMAGEFLGHGVFAWQLKPRFIEMLTAMTGFAGETASTLMRVIGVTDIAVAVLAIVKPIRIVLLYAAVWAFLTALARPIAGDPIWDFVERFANVGVPLALLFWRGWPKRKGEWLQ